MKFIYLCAVMLAAACGGAPDDALIADETATPTAELSAAAKCAKPVPSEDTDALLEPYVEALLENEALAGDLTDDEYGPILDRAIARLEKRAKRYCFPKRQAARRGMAAEFERVKARLRGEVAATAAHP